MSKQYSQLLYRRPYAGKGAEPETPEFIIRVFADEFKEWKKDPHSVPLVQVVDTMEVFHGKARAHTGTLERPSHAQLMDAFGSTKFEDIFAFMAEHGHLQPCGKHSSLEGEDKGMNKAKMMDNSSGIHG